MFREIWNASWNFFSFASSKYDCKFWNIPMLSKVSYFFISREKLLLEWYSEKGVSEWNQRYFFFHSGGKKKYRLISHREKNPGLFFPKIVYFRQKKISVIFLSYRSPYFCQICGLQMKKLTSYFGQNWGSQMEIKKYRLISVKTVYFWRK